MGVIQSGINQLIGTAAIAARLAPGFETRQELRKISKQEEVLQKQADLLAKSPHEEGTVGAEQADVVYKKQADLAQKRFELDPSKETLKQALLSQSGAYQKPLAIFEADPDEILREQHEIEGQMRAQQKAIRQLQQKENFNNFKGQISSDVQDTINIMKGKDVPTQAELDLDKKIRKVLPNFDDFGEIAKQHIREQFKEGGKK